MNYLTHQLLNSEELELLRTNLEKKDLLWEDGKRTAGTHAAKVKNNLQLRKDSNISKKFSTLITQKIFSHELIKSFALPKKVHGTTFSKSSIGMKYGRHIDNPYMSAGRADLSFTVFLSPKENYRGGALTIENLNSEETFKLNAGEIIIYPSTFLHSVEEVLDGERFVFIGWIESYVKSIEEREYLFDLDAAARSLLAKYGRSNEVDLLFKTYSNLLRRLGS
ncbi:Fe2+-dependent dioxygenase [Prochlorococcus sp. AH-736-F23]|nr:Fe2+-dependent dioxygenase [Prochlorococcus sp. AH-736-F23]